VTGSTVVVLLRAWRNQRDMRLDTQEHLGKQHDMVIGAWSFGDARGTTTDYWDKFEFEKAPQGAERRVPA